MVEEEFCPVASKDWTEMIRKVFYEANPMGGPRCGGQMKVISFLTDYRQDQGTFGPYQSGHEHKWSWGYQREDQSLLM